MKEVPHNTDTEQIVLGSILLENKNMNDVIDEVDTTDFYLDWHKEIYKAMSYLHYNQKEISYHTVIDRVSYKGDKEKLSNYIFELTDSVASMVNFQTSVNHLIDLSQKRKLYNHGHYLVTEDISGVTSENLVKMTEDVIDGINTVSNIETVTLKEYAKNWLKAFEEDKKPNTILFGFKELDKKIMFEEGNLGIVGARPGKNYCRA